MPTHIDSLDWALGRGHEVALDLLEAATHAWNVDRALSVAKVTRELVETLQQVENAALNRAEDVTGGSAHAGV